MADGRQTVEIRPLVIIGVQQRIHAQRHYLRGLKSATPSAARAYFALAAALPTRPAPER
ncbi:hypothetical protein ACGFNU_18200 [Spirillospora sp. NPDC048911]|uniref:hypothetical protein n=1 Tax=Spirillospora sp. NPDC048911 TaxID=3364527 RepID=UPI003720BC23